ncbi:MAG: fibrobacter succinogenes major paralogous domain-containing protein [Bacteroidota bacterium]
MKKALLTMYAFAITTMLISCSSSSGSKEPTSFNDVTIGKQIWMVENLNVEHFRNGDIIPEAKTNEEWEIAGENKEPAWCYYNNDPTIGAKYGKLYNWYAVNDQRGLAPQGWHVPSKDEWFILLEFIGGDELLGLGAGVLDSSEVRFAEKLKSISNWAENGNGSNESGFNGSPAGVRLKDGDFVYLGQYVGWFSSTENNAFSAWGCSLR